MLASLQTTKGNTITKPNPYPFSRIGDCIDEARFAKYITKG